MNAVHAFLFGLLVGVLYLTAVIGTIRLLEAFL